MQYIFVFNSCIQRKDEVQYVVIVPYDNQEQYNMLASSGGRSTGSLLKQVGKYWNVAIAECKYNSHY